MKFAVVLLSLLSVGRAAPLPGCQTLLTPVSVQKEQMLGRLHYIGGSSDLPGSRSLAHLMTDVRLDISATSQSHVLDFVQTQKIYGDCSSLVYNVTFENSTLLIERPFYLKEVYLPTDCPDCLVAYEEVTSAGQTFTSLMLFSKSQSVSPADEDNLRRQAECLQMPKPIFMIPDYEGCPDSTPRSEGISALNSLLENRMGHRVARVLDRIFDWLVN
ncbi:uncharacterized protein LOC128754587 [Synchiropus splendidus]|uniref:uncharacterized protein LOC128754587 n=1 Tax=Synchiropus splendidus TaxID=270530 RepID=UPI00237E96E0|nr:uncharacterized protein LOC128754587 [Synchiropus splendidus]